MGVRKMNLGGIISKDESGRVIEGIMNTEICSRCGGKCCKRIGCAYYPDDFDDLSFYGLKSKIDEGSISIDIDAEETMNLYLRARNIYASVIDLNASGICSALTDNGCSYEFDKRPTQGRLLVPVESTNCKSNISAKDLGVAWQENQEVLRELRAYYKNKLKKRDLTLADGTALIEYVANHLMLDVKDRRTIVEYKEAEPSGFCLDYNFLETINWLYEYNDFIILYDAIWHSCKGSIYTILRELDKSNLLTEDIFVRDIVACILYSV
ncbi:hypothetical protein UT300012_21350 [Paraclostridium bifermentans]